MTLIPVLDLINIAILSVAVLHLIIGVLVLARGERRQANILFASLELSLIIWSACMVYYRSAGPGEIALWAKALYVAALFIPFSFLYFVYSFPQERFERFPLGWRLASFVPPVFFIWATITNRLITSVVRADPGEPHLFFDNVFYIPYVLYFAVYFGWAYLFLAHSAHTYAGRNSVLKIQTNYVLFGTAISTIFATPPNLILPMFGIFVVNWLGQVVIVVMALSITYAIFKHNLLNIKVIAAELFAGLIGLIFIIQLFLSQSALELFARLALLGIVAVFIYFLIKSVFQEIRSREEIERLNRAMSEFVAITSHQIRTPLTHIKDALSLVREGDYGLVDARAMPVLNRVYLSTGRLIGLVNDLLDMSRMESGRMQYVLTDFDFISLMDSVAAEFKIPAEEKGVAINWQIDKRPIYVRGDKEKLRQVVFNLIDNALKYTSTGTIEIKVTDGAGAVESSVKDSGIGMSKETLNQLFKKFSRGESGPKTKTEGTGLGLYVAKRIVDDHKGELWAESEGAGKGSVFHLKLVTSKSAEGTQEPPEGGVSLPRAA